MKRWVKLMKWSEKPYLPTSSVMNEKPIMTVKEARKLLGKKYEKMTDQEIAKLIDEVDMLAQMALRLAKEERLKGNLPPNAGM